MIKKDDILDASIELFSRDGFYNTGMRDIASEAGVAIGTIYHHFEDKNSILVYILRDAIEERRRFMEELRQNESSVHEKIEQIIELHFERFRRRSALGRLIVTQSRQPGDELQDVYRELYQDIAEFVTELMDEGVRRGVVTSTCDPCIVSYALVGAMENITMKLMETDPDDRDDRMYERASSQLTHLLWNGLAER